MKYIGNKTRLLDFILDSIKASNIPLEGTFIDIFSGTGSVGRHFKELGFRIISNDLMTYSYFAQYVSLKINSMPSFEHISYKGIDGVLEILNDASLKKEGYIYNNFAPGGKEKRQYFSDENAQRIDAIRDKIEEWNIQGKLSEEEYCILVNSLIDASDFVANVAGTYGAYLKIWRSMALKRIELKKPEIFNNEKNNIVFQKDANTLIKEITGDILYLDPPYNSRQYAPNFHVLETLAVWDKQPLTGKCGQRDYTTKKSRYCSKKDASVALSELIRQANVKYIVMSYNNEGIIPSNEIVSILSSRGEVVKYQQIYRRFRTERDNENRHYKDCDDKVSEILYVVGVNN